MEVFAPGPPLDELIDDVPFFENDGLVPVDSELASLRRRRSPPPCAGWYNGPSRGSRPRAGWTERTLRGWIADEASRERHPAGGPDVTQIAAYRSGLPASRR